LAKVTQLSPGLWQISLPFLGEHEIIGSYLLAGENELAILCPCCNARKYAIELRKIFVERLPAPENYGI